MVWSTKPVKIHRQGASDGHFVLVCLNPKAPVIQLKGDQSEKFYTTPKKTYFVPKLWTRTSYVSPQTKLHFLNLHDDDSVYYAIDEGPFNKYNQSFITIQDLFLDASENSTHRLSLRNGLDGVVKRRTFIIDPAPPTLDESQRNMLWKNEEERLATVDRLKQLSPFSHSYEKFKSDYYSGAKTNNSNVRDGWRGTASRASKALGNAFYVTIEGVENALDRATSAKLQLLRFMKYEAVGNELINSQHTPAKDFMNELGQTIHLFADAGIAYNFLASNFRQADSEFGMTAIEEIAIRDGLAKIVNNMLKARANFGFNAGGGDTHWGHGYDLAIGMIALAMPGYQTPYYGVSGADMRSTHTFKDPNSGFFYNPYPDIAPTWYAASTQSDIEKTGFPNIAAAFRAHYLLSDDGWWVGPNDLAAEGDRYCKGPGENRLVDIAYGGIANCEKCIELVEMAGYENPFYNRLIAFTNLRRMAGDNSIIQAVDAYIGRLTSVGVRQLLWNEDANAYTLSAANYSYALSAFHSTNRHAHLNSSKKGMKSLLHDLDLYYNSPSELSDTQTKKLDQTRKKLYDPYVLAFLSNPDTIPSPPTRQHRPVIKPLYKYVVSPGEQIVKEISYFDLDDDALTAAVSNLPNGALFDAVKNTITWTPTADDTGIHIIKIAVADRTYTTTRPFAIIVKKQKGITLSHDSIPSLQTQVALTPSTQVTLSWEHPVDVTPAFYTIYRDGIPITMVSGDQLSYVDNVNIILNDQTNYTVSFFDSSGTQSKNRTVLVAIQ